MKTTITYLLVALFSFAFSYKTVKYAAKLKTVEICCVSDMDCENEKENTTEKDEVTDNFYHFSFNKDLFIAAESYIPAEFLVSFTSSNYSNSVYCPPETCCC